MKSYTTSEVRQNFAAILEEAGDRRLLLTRLSQEMFETLSSPHRAALDHDDTRGVQAVALLPVK